MIFNRIDFSSPIPYYLQLIETLKERLDQGAWNPGDQLPSEPDLCRFYGVSRTVVRQALLGLEQEGLILRRKGKGTFAAEAKIAASLVQKLTGFHQDMQERGHRVQTQVLHCAVEPASARVAHSLHLPAGRLVYNIERLRFVDGEAILLVTTYLPQALCPRLGEFDLSQFSLYNILEKEFGLVLDHGSRTIEAVAANKREAQLLDVPEGAPMMMLDSVTCLADGTPVEVYHAIHRGDRSRFEVELVRVNETERG
jgi:GntR family transcriptional regulator